MAKAFQLDAFQNDSFQVADDVIVFVPGRFDNEFIARIGRRVMTTAMAQRNLISGIGARIFTVNFRNKD